MELPKSSLGIPNNISLLIQLVKYLGVLMSARQLSRLAKAKGLDPLLGGGLNAELENSDEESDLEEEVGNGPFVGGSTVVASVRI